MDRWADYLVSGVCYDKHKKMVKELEIRIYGINRISEDKYHFPRSKVITLMKHRVTFSTIVRAGENWEKGQRLNLVSVQGEDYLQTGQFLSESDIIRPVTEYEC